MRPILAAVCSAVLLFSACGGSSDKASPLLGAVATSSRAADANSSPAAQTQPSATVAAPTTQGAPSPAVLVATAAPATATPAPPTATAVPPTQAPPTATASPAPATPRPATATFTVAAVTKPAAPACYVAGRDSCNCSHFSTHAAAQAFHDNYDPTDINKLDTDHDGIVCETLR